MKTIFKSIAALSFALLAFSCAKEIQKPIENGSKADSFEYSFRVSSAESDDATKTVIDGTTLKWEVGDKIAVFATGSTNRYGEISTIAPSVVFPVALNAALSEGSKVYAYFPYSSGNGSATADAISLVIPASQTGDSDAMPQVALPYTTTADMAKATHNVDDLYFCNLGSVIRFLIYSAGSAYTGETVESVRFNADKALAGSFTFDLTAVDYSDKSTLAISGYSATSVKLTAAPAIGTTADNAEAVDMVVAPGTYYGSIVVETNAARYTYEITSGNAIAFARSSIQRIGLNLESVNCTRVAKHPLEVYVPATSIAAGDRILLAGAKTGATKVFGYDKGNNRFAYDYTINDGIIVSSVNTYPLTLGDGGTANYYTLYDLHYNGYVSAVTSGSSNNMKTLDAVDGDNSKWQIVVDGNSKATKLEATNSEYTKKYMRYNSGSNLFSCYNSADTQSDIYVFKMTTSTVVSALNQDIAYDVTSVEIPYAVYNGSGATTANIKTDPGSCTSSFAHNAETKRVTFNITANDTGAARIVEVDITNNGETKTVSITQAAEPVKLVMSDITAVPGQNQIVFNWTAVDNVEGYQVSINGGSTYLATQAATSYTWTGLSSFTDYTIKVKAIGDEVYFITSDPKSRTQKTTLAVPTGLTWTKGTKTVSWTDPNSGVGTYGTDYKYQYTIDNGANFVDIANATSVTLSIDATKTFKIKAVYPANTTLNSSVSDGLLCVVGTPAVFTADFEGDGEHRSSGSNSYGTNNYTEDGISCTLQYADAVSSTQLDGSYVCTMRSAKKTNNCPSFTTANILSTTKDIKKITYWYKHGSGASTYHTSQTLEYSTDGTNWTAVSPSADSDVHATFGYSYTFASAVNTNTFYVRFTVNCTGHESDNSTRDSYLDNLIVYGDDPE